VSRRRTVLITGFGPFPGAPFNPSGPLARRLARIRRPAFTGVARIGHVFATCYRAVDDEWPALIARHRPDAVLMFGLATRTRHVRIETQARNALSAFPDASGHAAKRSAIARGAPARLPMRAPRAALLHAARRGKIPARLSRDAGRYLCNYLYWRALEAAARPGGPAIVAFIHIPNVRRPDLGRTPVRRQAGRRLAFVDLARTGEALLATMVAALKSPRPR
jgi:pyroglutamyl-peptidase